MRTRETAPELQGGMRRVEAAHMRGRLGLAHRHERRREPLHGAVRPKCFWGKATHIIKPLDPYLDLSYRFGTNSVGIFVCVCLRVCVLVPIRESSFCVKLLGG